MYSTMNLKQMIDHYEGLTGIKEKLPYQNDLQYLDYLVNTYKKRGGEPLNIKLNVTDVSKKGRVK